LLKEAQSGNRLSGFVGQIEEDALAADAGSPAQLVKQVASHHLPKEEFIVCVLKI
jgi:hypothetical protein